MILSLILRPPPEQMRLIIDELNNATVQYDKGFPIMSDKEWDEWYFRLKNLEAESGIVYGDSPTQKIVYSSTSLVKVAHNHPMLSLDKSKDVKDVLKFCGDREVAIMPKMDGLTCSLLYKDGKLVRAETRGNGEVGDDITANMMTGIVPIHIKDLTGEMVIDGELIMTYEHWNEWNEAHLDNRFSHPRNAAAGSARLISPKQFKERRLSFVAWDLIKCDTKDKEEPFRRHDVRLMFLANCGFEVVPCYVASPLTEEKWKLYSEDIEQDVIDLSYPLDGLVVKFNDKLYGDSLGATAHHRKNAFAYKFYDETEITFLRSIDWTMGKTGVLTPVAVFDEVTMDENVISRANLHNISILEDILQVPYEGQKIEIYRANQIIPQVLDAQHIPEGHNIIEYPKICPCCGAPVEIQESNGVKLLRCTSTQCSGKLINILDSFCGKKGLDIKGLSKATLEKLIDWGWVSEYADIFTLAEHKNEWIKKPGFGAASVQNKLDAIEKARECRLENFIAAINIKDFGLTMAKELVKQFPTWEAFKVAIDERYNFASLPGIGEITCANLLNHNYSAADKVIPFIKFISVSEANNPISEVNNSLERQVFVITGKLQHYRNRDELTKVITEHGGKVSNSITGKTNYLINNDIESTSAKNVKAKSLNIPIISEDDFIKMISN